MWAESLLYIRTVFICGQSPCCIEGLCLYVGRVLAVYKYHAYMWAESLLYISTILICGQSPCCI